MTDLGHEAVRRLLDGNARFRARQPVVRTYGPSELAALARGQQPFAAIVACADSRVAPEVIFDQPLGNLLVSRVPANVAAESVRWMLDIAVGELAVPLVLVLGHTECRAIQRVISGISAGADDALDAFVRHALEHARADRPADLFRATVRANALQTVELLLSACPPLRTAVERGRTAVCAGCFDIASGQLELLERESTG